MPHFSHVLIVLPLLIPLATAALCLLARKQRMQYIAGVGGAALHCAATCALLAAVMQDGIITSAIGDWRAPYGIVLVADTFSAVLVCLAGVIGLLCAVYACGEIDAHRVRYGFFPVYHVLLMGVCGAFLTGDIFNLFVCFEVMLMASFVLLALGAGRAQIEASVKYVAINLLSSIIFLSAVGILYGKTGTLNMADLAVRLGDFSHPSLALVLALMFLTTFGLKAGMFPLFFWLPASYHTPPTVITTLFSALLTKVGVYAMVRVFTVVFQDNAAALSAVLLPIAVLTMVTGVLGAVAQYDFRRLLSFHIVSQIGYLILGLGIALALKNGATAELALASVLYYTVHVALAKSALFLASGIARELKNTFDLKKLGGLYQQQPLLAILFLIAAFSLAGFPPFSGFFAKFGILRAAVEAQQPWLVAAALGVSLLTLFSMIKIWSEAFWKSAPETAPRPGPPTASPWLYAPLGIMSALCLLMGLAAGPAFSLCLTAAAEVLDSQQYIAAVLGSQP